MDDHSAFVPARSGEHHYLDNRRSHNELVAPYIIAARQWASVAFISLAIAAIAVSGLVAVGVRSKTVPYVVEVDKLGSVAAIRRADEATAVDPRVMRATLANWIVYMRSVVPDTDTERLYITRAYSTILARGSAVQKANEFFLAASPFARAREARVEVASHAVLQLGPNTYQIEWTETERALDGRQIGKTDWVATVQVVVVPPADEAAEQANPLGIFVETFDWRRRVASLENGRRFA